MLPFLCLKYSAVRKSKRQIIPEYYHFLRRSFATFTQPSCKMKLSGGSDVTACPHGRIKKKIFLASILLFLSAVALSQDEPSLKIQVIADNRIISINDGDTIQLQGHPVVIRTEKMKTFKLAGLQFEYPRDYAYKFEEVNDFRSWILDGNNFVIMIFEFGEKAELGKFTREMVRKFGKKNCTVEDRTIQLDDRMLKGNRINVNLLGAKITFDIFPLSLAENKTHIIAFQDTKTWQGSDSPEGLGTMHVIAESIQINP
jgi:hypothetical protein